MDRESVIALINEKESTLAHYGIRGMRWGDRRYQNEDGSLTPEGRKRYGLKPDYSGLTDQQLRDAINRKRMQNQYIELRTAGVRKKQQEREGLIRAASDVTGKTVKLATTGVDIQTNRKIEENKPLIEAKDPQAIEYGKELGKSLKLTKDVNKLTGNITGFASSQAGNVAKLSVHDELINATREAREAMDELDEQELRKTVDRMLLEKQYDELVNPPKPSKVEKGREVLQTIGSVMGVALTGIMIAQAIKGLIKKKDIAQSSLNDGSEYLEHYRTKGSKNGVRRYQNEDGSLTPEGYRHYGIDPNGRQSTPQEIEARARAQMRAQQEKIKMQRRVEAGGARYARREAIKDAKNQARINSIYAREEAKTQREMAKLDRTEGLKQTKLDLKNRRASDKIELKAKAENRANIRKNIVKGVAAVAAIAGAVMIGRHILKERSLNNQLVRDITKINTEHKNSIEKIRAETKKLQLTDVNLIGEQNRHKEAMTALPHNMKFRTLQEQNKHSEVLGRQTLTKELETMKYADLRDDRAFREREAAAARTHIETLKNKDFDMQKLKGSQSLELEALKGRNALDLADTKGQWDFNLQEQKDRGALAISNNEVEKTRINAESMMKKAENDATAAYNKGQLDILKEAQNRRRQTADANAKWKKDNPEAWTLKNMIDRVMKGNQNQIVVGDNSYTKAQAQKVASDNGLGSISSLKPEELKKLFSLLVGGRK